MDEDGVIITPPVNSQAPAGDDDGLPAQDIPAKPQAPEPQPDSQAEEDEERIFDISPDLDISEEIIGSAEAAQTKATSTALNDPTAAKTAPANPQPKKIGEAYGDMAEKQARTTAAQNRQNLQDAISTIIPEKLRASLPGQAAKPPVPTPASPASMPIERQSPPKPPIPRPVAPMPNALQPSMTPVKAPAVSSAAPADQRFPAYASATPASKPSAISTETVHTGAPQASLAPVPTQNSMPAPAIAPKPPVKLSSDPNIKPLRTYESDVADVLFHRNISQASMTIAENKKRGKEENARTPMPTIKSETLAVNAPTASVADAIREAEEPPSRAGLKWFLAILSLTLVAGGIFGGYYFYERSPLAAPAPQPTAPQAPRSVIKAESQSVIAIDGLNANAIASKIKAEMAKPQSPNSIKEIILAETENGALVRASPADALGAIGIAPPDMITRTLQPQWMLGVYADASSTKSAFVIVETDFFQNAFAGMLQWEAGMPFDLQPYIYAQATSTVIQGRFEDRIVKNADAREFTATDGQALFLYSFIDSSKLAITGNEAALSEIIYRLEQQAFVR